MNGGGFLGGTTLGDDTGSLRYWEGNNSGGFSRCIHNCTLPGATWSSWRGSWTGDTQSFVLPVHLFHGGIAGGDDCPAAGTTSGCGHLLAGTTRVWETVLGAGSSFAASQWYVTNNPITANLTKGTLGNRSYINQVKYSPKYQSVAIAGTNDGNVQIGFNLGTGVQAQATWVDVTGGNAVLPNRPIQGIALDPSSPAPGTPTGYAAVGGFNNNTPSTPGHVFRVVCTMTSTPCDGFTWTDKTGNLPDIPVDSIIVNPNFPSQVFAGSDFGLYYTDDITANPPVWNRFNNGLPNVMIWDMSVDRGSTTLALWTRSRGAYAWPLPTGPENPLPTSVSVATASGIYGGTTTLSATLTSGGNPVSGKSISFTLNGNPVGSATTNGAGTATLSGVSLAGINAGSYPTGVQASFAGDSIYAASSGTGMLNVSPLDVSAVVGIAKGGLGLNLVTGRFAQTVTLTNNSASTIPGPISLVIDNLTSNATVYGASGTTDFLALPISPYVNYSGSLATRPEGLDHATVHESEPRPTLAIRRGCLAGPGAR